MSETWADAQFDMLEAAYDEVPIEAKARIAQLERENAEALQMLANQAATIKRQIDGLHARDELIRDLHENLCADCDRCESLGACCDGLPARMRELGIEV